MEEMKRYVPSSTDRHAQLELEITTTERLLSDLRTQQLEMHREHQQMVESGKTQESSTLFEEIFILTERMNKLLTHLAVLGEERAKFLGKKILKQ